MKSRAAAIFALCILLVSALAGCRRVPSGIIGVKDMSKLLADLHTAEAVVEINRPQYPTDSTKQALKQTVFVKHGVTEEQFDSSLMWYGRNIDKYIEVYDDAIAILEKRSVDAGAQVMQTMVAGDSADVWVGSRYYIISNKLPTRLLSFDIEADTAISEPGDFYTWRMKFIGVDAGTVRWTMVANYADSCIEHLNQQTTNSGTLRNGWNEITFVTDSSKTLQRLRGTVEINLDNMPIIWIDSIALVRKPIDEERYKDRTRQRRYHELRIKPSAKEPESDADLKPQNQWKLQANDSLLMK